MDPSRKLDIPRLPLFKIDDLQVQNCSKEEVETFFSSFVLCLFSCVEDATKVEIIMCSVLQHSTVYRAHMINLNELKSLNLKLVLSSRTNHARAQFSGQVKK